MKQHYKYLILLVYIIGTMIILALSNCGKDDKDNKIQTITGYVQKGPFVSGSSVTVYDLKSDLSATGKTYVSQITDNKGTFTLKDVSLSSNYVSLRADGFYFNEVSGKQSVSQITLYALADINNKTKININILTNLEKARVEYLIKSGKSFSEAKTQAQKEVLSIFNITKTNVSLSEDMSISEAGDDNGILLAVSAILQGFRSESELTELLSNISNDIEKDGTLDNTALGSALVSQAKSLDTVSIKNNLQKRYQDLGSSAVIPVFGKYITEFVSNTAFIADQSLINYPATGNNGENILLLSKTNYTYSSSYSLTAQVPKGASLKIKITSLSNSDTSSVIKSTWMYQGSSNQNWTISSFDNASSSQTFTAVNSGITCDLKMIFEKGSYLIEYYDITMTSPNRQKTIHIK